MANAQLVEYIRKEIAAGISKDDIAKVLATTGWQKDAIDEAFAAVPAMGDGLAAVQTVATPVVAAHVQPHKSHLWVWVGVCTGVLILLVLGVFGAYAFGLIPSLTMSDSARPTATTTLPVATSTEIVAPVATTTATSTLPILPPVVSTSTPVVSTTPVVCTTQDCFANAFATCTLATYATEMGILTAADYKILGVTPGGCTMSFTYTKNINAAWANKSMTCTFNNKLEFKASVENTFTLALAGKSSCVGPLATLLKTPATPPKP